MGKKKKQTKPAKAEPPKTGMDRAQFLKIAGGSLAAILAAGAPAAYFLHNHIDWGFVNRGLIEFQPEVVTLEFMQKNPAFVQIGEEVDFNDNHLKKVMLDAAAKKVAEMGFSSFAGTEKFKATMFGLVESPEYTCNLRKYCLRSLDYLTGVLGVQSPITKWVDLKRGDNYSAGYDNQGFLGNRYFLNVNVGKEMGNKKFVEIANVFGYSGSRAFKNHYKDELRGKFCFIGVGQTALLAPISEVLHVDVSQSTIKVIRSINYAEGLALEEAVVESLSQVIARNLAEKIKIPNAIQVLDKLYNDMTAQNPQKPDELVFPEYKYLTRVMKLVEISGPKEVYEAYKQDPMRFRDLVMKGRF